MSTSPLPLRFDFLPAWQAATLYCLLAIPIFWLGARSMSSLGSFRKWASIAIRLDLLMFLVLLIAGARWEQTPKNLSVVVVRDVSRSTSNVHSTNPAGLQMQVSQYVREAARNKPADDRIGAVSFDRLSMVDALPSANPAAAGDTACVREWADGTNVAQALRMAMAAMPADTMRRIVLLWDGNATTGDLDNAVEAAASQHIPIDVVSLDYNVEQEICLQRLVAPANRRQNEPVTLDAIISSHNRKAVSATLSVSDGSACVRSSLPIVLQPGANVIHVAVPPLAAGTHPFHAAVQPTIRSTDSIRENNAADAVTIVHGPSRVLLVGADDSGDLQPLRSVLLHRGVEVDDQPNPSLLPHTAADLQPYDAIVLANVARGGPNGVTPEQDRALARYVRDLGGGLLMIGGPNTFGAGGWAGSEVEKVLPVNCQPPENDPMTPGELVIAIDRSASMGERFAGSTRTKQEVANESAAMALRSLLPCDRVGVLAFNTTPQWIVPLAENVQRELTSNAIARITAGGDTDIPSALSSATDTLNQPSTIGRPRPLRHVLLLTDGQSRDASLLSTVAAMQRAGITLSTVGIGVDADQKLLAFLAWMGHGRSYSVTDPTMLPQVVIKEARTVDGSLVRERPFTPRVTGVDALSSSVSTLPPLRGLVMTWPKMSPAVKLSLVGDDGEPVLAHWQSGLGRAAAFTSDAGPRWAGQWLDSPAFNQFWSHVLRTTVRPDPPAGVVARIIASNPDRAQVIVDAGAGEGSVVPLSATILSPDERQPATQVRLIRSADGSYRGDFATPDIGTYVVVVHDTDPARGSIEMTPAVLVASTSAELSDLQSDDRAVHQIAERTGGRVLPALDVNANLFARAALQPQPVSLPLTEKLAVLAIITLLLDVAVRRIAWDRQTFARVRGLVADSIRSFTQVRVGDPAFSVGSLLYVHACLNERQQEQHQKQKPVHFDRPRLTRFEVRERQSGPTMTPPVRTTRTAPTTLDALLTSRRQRIEGTVADEIERH